jgi:hypothetical protein
VLYTDDSLLAGPDKEEIDRIIEQLQSKAKLSITVEGDLADFLGLSIDRRPDGTIHLSQPHLIDQILEDLRLNKANVKARLTPAASSKLLTRHSDSKPFDNWFNYRSLIGKLNYLEKATRRDIVYAVHQCARFVSDPKKEHGDAVRWLGRYLLGTKDKVTIMRPMSDKDLESMSTQASVAIGILRRQQQIVIRRGHDTATSLTMLVARSYGNLSCKPMWRYRQPRASTQASAMRSETQFLSCSY